MVDTDPSQLASYAIRSLDSGGREHAEPDDPLRGPFEVDRHRIIESAAFRRLEGKTQVFAPAWHDHFRTRMTHTLEATQIARCLAVQLRANEQLAEAITLAHDLGHPPFGHAGEAALGEAMVDSGGFNHNAHTLRVVGYLEHPFPAFRGLNLTAATRAGLSAHVTPYDVPSAAPGQSTDSPRAADGMESAVGGSLRGSAGELPVAASVEAQIVSVADRIAYNHHDLEDAIGARLLDLESLQGLTLWRSVLERVSAGRRIEHVHSVRRLVLDGMIDEVLTDVIETSGKLLAAVPTPKGGLQNTEPLVQPSESMAVQCTELEKFLVERVYRQPDVAETDLRGRGMVLGLFSAYRKEPGAMPNRFVVRIDEQGLDRVVCDYIAGMTDRFCEREHTRLVGS